ncbi:hypothetical protein [Kutzneria buriramensis]|uniref:Uncharacterized protein n=1 Tax=Kutzneria buriramensis TaxID=1045776 RepID=A0A3E0HID7_9PSEU|nr:hypothetical protein [Kutzneria buriramensis]REH46197.1 hypothetical protein BCF44_107330 [Kutzneria buriramensis]
MLIQGGTTLVTALLPDCTLYGTDSDPGSPPFTIWIRTAYNGCQRGARDLTVAHDEATSNTSRAVAQTALPILSA